jgi:hypothetical protein
VAYDLVASQRVGVNRISRLATGARSLVHMWEGEESEVVLKVRVRQ